MAQGLRALIVLQRTWFNSLHPHGSSQVSVTSSRGQAPMENHQCTHSKINKEIVPYLKAHMFDSPQIALFQTAEFPDSSSSQCPCLTVIPRVSTLPPARRMTEKRTPMLSGCLERAKLRAEDLQLLLRRGRHLRR